MTAPLVLTCGDPAGIGPEIVIRAWLERERLVLPPFYVLGDPDFMARRAQRLGLDLPIKTGDDAAAFADALPVAPLSARFTDRPGMPDPQNAAGTIEAIERAVADMHRGRAAGLVTAPIAKKPLYDAGFAFPGHTEFLGHLAQTVYGAEATPVMMLAGPQLRAVPVTIHIALAEVPRVLTRDAIVETGRIVARDLATRFAIPSPRLAVSGLNPHAGESGAMGREEIDIIMPAIEVLRAEGIAVAGPLPADTMFHPAARATYDAAICMYHDQALIPAKALAFDETVNVTLGLPFIRTSPDHGTAFDIADKGVARPDSIVAAIRLAASMARGAA